MRPQYISVLIIASWFFVACTTDSASYRATAESILENPPPSPDFVMPIPLERAGSECVEIRQSKIWEAGDTEFSLQRHLAQHTRLFVDGLEISQPRIMFHLVPDVVLDDDSAIIVRLGGPMIVCLDVNVFSTGAHLAEIRFESTSGIQYSYQWAFESP
jgi:hypothetical protein